MMATDGIHSCLFPQTDKGHCIVTWGRVCTRHRAKQASSKQITCVRGSACQKASPVLTFLHLPCPFLMILAAKTSTLLSCLILPVHRAYLHTTQPIINILPLATAPPLPFYSDPLPAFPHHLCPLLKFLKAS